MRSSFFQTAIPNEHNQPEAAQDRHDVALGALPRRLVGDAAGAPLEFAASAHPSRCPARVDEMPGGGSGAWRQARLRMTVS
ncbi:MAG: hypothetical protein R2932_23715 [Caldilineaceae bacterium]